MKQNLDTKKSLETVFTSQYYNYYYYNIIIFSALQLLYRAVAVTPLHFQCKNLSLISIKQQFYADKHALGAPFNATAFVFC
jgi:hypothetical protein